MIPAAELNSAHLRKLLEQEEAAAAGTLANADPDEGPSMMSLRSPTTRTLYAIHRNNNHFRSVKAFMAAAEAERDQFVALVDEAEALRNDPILPTDLQLLPGRCRDKQIVQRQTALKAAAAAGEPTSVVEGEEVLNVPADEAVKDWDGSQDEDHMSDWDIAARITFTYPRDAAGSMVVADHNAVSESAARHRGLKAAIAETAAKDITVVGIDELHPAATQRQTMQKTTTTTSLRDLLLEQKTSLAAAEVDHQGYVASTKISVAARQQRVHELNDLLRLDGR